MMILESDHSGFWKGLTMYIISVSNSIGNNSAQMEKKMKNVCARERLGVRMTLM